MSKKFLLIDGNYLMFQSFYASYNSKFPNNLLRSPDGRSANGVHIFLQTFFKVLKYFKPSHLFVAFDAHGKTKRHELFNEYKSGRNKAPEIIFEQFEIIKEILTSMNVKWFEKVGDEADDLIATLATKNKEFDNLIFSKDKDLLQLVNENTSIIKVLKDKNNFTYYELDTLKNFFENYNINPFQIPDYKGLAGDSSDNLKGVNGIGEKKAISLLNEFNTLEEIYNNIGKLKGKTVEYLLNDKENAFFCKKLAILNKNVEMNNDIDFYAVNINIQNSFNIFKKFGLNLAAENLKKIIDDK
ncbi:DNA polymerase I [Mycoplasmopsis maculosa]|uniref:5'-3' exonuclease n=1 Tax=Mycoplasmopsis maculosa TaxID=114885 RepID=A0A449B5C5_9BACT|nr:5'-3' exonuclease H3TH domain-containing protein [Mycoplasmopsis maculosa]VEU75728.1 DNA polymerase I [Mycoplasmopsis maculosa]